MPVPASVGMGIVMVVMPMPAVMVVMVVMVVVPASGMSAPFHTFQEGGEDRCDRRADDFGEECLVDSKKHRRHHDALHVRSEERQRLRARDERREPGGIF